MKRLILILILLPQLSTAQAIWDTLYLPKANGNLYFDTINNKLFMYMGSNTYQGQPYNTWSYDGINLEPICWTQQGSFEGHVWYREKLFFYGPHSKVNNVFRSNALVMYDTLNKNFTSIDSGRTNSDGFFAGCEFNGRLYFGSRADWKKFNLRYIDTNSHYVLGSNYHYYYHLDTILGDISDLIVYKGRMLIASSSNYGVLAQSSGTGYLDSNFVLHPFGTGLNCRIFKFKIYNNKLLAMGCFNAASGDSTNKIAVYNDSLDKWEAFSPTLLYYPYNGNNLLSVTSLTPYENRLVINGYITRAGNKVVNQIVVWDENGYMDYGYHEFAYVFSSVYWNGSLIINGYNKLTTGEFIARLIYDPLKDGNNVQLFGNLFILKPNPTKEKTLLHTKSTKQCIYYLIGINGNVVQKGFFNNEKTIDTSEIPKGAYTLIVSEKDNYKPVALKLVVE